MIILIGIVGMIIIVIFFSTVFNPDFMQGYRNSKFLDELMQEDQQPQESDTKELANEQRIHAKSGKV